MRAENMYRGGQGKNVKGKNQYIPGMPKKKAHQHNIDESGPPMNLKGEIIKINNMKLTKKAIDPFKPPFPKIHVDKSKPILMCYTDGGCDKNGREVNTGSYAFAIIENDTVLYEYSRKVSNTTNNKMELQAIIDCLEYIEEKRLYEPQIILHSDSQYCIHGICSWRHGWIQRNWKDVKNVEQWKQLSNLVNILTNVQYKWVRAHQEDDSVNTKWNNYVDRLCQNEIAYKPFISREEGAKVREVLRTPFGSEKCVVVPVVELEEANDLLLAVYNIIDLDNLDVGSIWDKMEEYLKKHQLIK